MKELFSLLLVGAILPIAFAFIMLLFSFLSNSNLFEMYSKSFTLGIFILFYIVSFLVGWTIIKW